jgi:hypothetical protein
MNFDEMDLDLDAGITCNITKPMANAHWQMYPEAYAYYAEKMPELWDLIAPEPLVLDWRGPPKIKVLRDPKDKAEAYTLEMVRDIAMGCRNRREFIRQHGGAYQYCKRHGIDISEWLPKKTDQRRTEVKGLITLLGWDSVYLASTPAIRQWMRDHRGELIDVENKL